MIRSYEVLRVFTRGIVGGNHLGVLTELDGLSDADMTDIAKELGFSETVFIDLDQPTPHCRIFTPTNEMPFAGHPLVGATWALHQLFDRPVNTVTCGIGEVSVTANRDAASIGVALPQDVDTIVVDASLLGLPDPVAAFEVFMPLRYTVLELETQDDVAALELEEAVLAVSRDGEHMLTYSRNGDEIRSRFFAPSSGIFEDPATGSAAVALAACLQARGESSGTATISQGEEIGSPSTISMSWSNGSASIGGTVVHDETQTLSL